MGILADNIGFIIKSRGLSYTKLAKKLSDKEISFSKDQIYSYQSEKYEPNDVFKSRLAEYAGVSVSKLESKVLTPADLQTKGIQGDYIEDAAGMIIENQIEILGTQRAILDLLMELRGARVVHAPNSVRDAVKGIVQDYTKQVRDERKLKS